MPQSGPYSMGKCWCGRANTFSFICCISSFFNVTADPSSAMSWNNREGGAQAWPIRMPHTLNSAKPEPEQPRPESPMDSGPSTGHRALLRGGGVRGVPRESP